MNNLNLNKNNNLIQQIVLGCSSLNKLFKIVRMMFIDYKCMIINDYDGNYDKVIEVRHNGATMVCVFKDYICDSVRIFPDYNADVFHYIELCSMFYTYCSVRNVWMNDDYTIKIDNDNGECNILIKSI